MPLKFPPKSEREIRESMLLPDGEYDFEVTKAEEAVSKNGNDMIALTLAIYDNAAQQITLRDWLVASSAALSQLKILRFCQATGIAATYEEGNLDAMTCYGLAGRCVIGSREQQGYPPQNVIVDYIPHHAPPESLGVPTAQAQRARKAQAERDAAAAAAGFPDPEIPF